MFIAKPHANGKPVALDAEDKQEGLVRLDEVDGPKLLQAQDSLYTNPDGASATVNSAPAGLAAPSTSGRAGNVSGKGKLQKTAQTTVPMSNPFPAASNSIRTNPSTIAK